MFIPAGVTVTVSQWVKIHCQGAVVIAGSLNACGQGEAGGAAPPLEEAGKSGISGNISTGGAGGGSVYGSGGSGGVKRDFFCLNSYEAIAKGSGGGSGSSLTGSSWGGAGGGGSGGGGRIMVVAASISNSGNITAAGGTGGANGGSKSYRGADGSPGYLLIEELGAM